MQAWMRRATMGKQVANKLACRKKKIMIFYLEIYCSRQ